MTYRHGGNIREIAQRYGIEVSAILDFSANINPLGPSPLAMEAIRNSLEDIVNYPDTEATLLIDALCRYHQIPPKNILPGNGATELIYLVPRAFRPNRALIVAPAFSEYERALRLAGCEVEHFILPDETEFQVDPAPLLSAMGKGYDMLWMGNPSNPAGSLASRERVLEIANNASRLGMTLVVDEAFIDYCEGASVKEAVIKNERFIVIRSMTKFFALAGLRIGYLLGHERMVAKLKEQKEPWTLNSLGEAAAVASLGDKTYIEESRAFMEKERVSFIEKLQRLKGLKVYGSAANYLLLRLEGGTDGRTLQHRLVAEHNILIRDCSNYIGLDERFFRVAIRSGDENERLIEGIGNING